MTFLLLSLFNFISHEIDSNLLYTYLPTTGPSWPWSYGSWIYNYLCNQCLSPL